MLPRRWLTAVLLVMAAGASCRPSPTRPTLFSPLSVLEVNALNATTSVLGNLDAISLCADSLGRRNRGSSCAPCVPAAAQQSPIDAHRHAMRMWTMSGKSPHARTDSIPNCARLAHEFATSLDPSNYDYRLEFALFQLMSAEDSVRAHGFAVIDALLDTMLLVRDTSAAMGLLEKVGSTSWERAQRMLTRSSAVTLDERERSVHNRPRGLVAFKRLPSLPTPSQQLGTSEAVWASQLFSQAAALTQRPAPRSRFMRLALAPHIVLADWRAVDSVADALGNRALRDSVSAAARAVGLYHRFRYDVASHPLIMAALDTALRTLPRADSAATDNFDDVFTARDDEWRYGFLPGVRQELETRGWSVIDPIWLTPVNEIRMAKRARVLEANFRYAHLAKPGQSGSETPSGVMFVKSGPFQGWRTRNAGRGELIFSWAWSTFGIDRYVLNDEAWKTFYSDRLAEPRLAAEEVSTWRACPNVRRNVVYECVRDSPASWMDVLFAGVMDTVDVTLARFRAGGDSSDVYLGARVPLRSFRYSGMSRVRVGRDSLEIGATIKTSTGTTLYSNVVRRPMPRASESTWAFQWRTTLGYGSVMHRVEALDRSYARAARGAALLTSADAATLELKGFGMSDVLVAQAISPARPLVRSWRDLDVTPSGGVMSPRGTLALAWEIYDLMPDTDGMARWRVTVQRETGQLLASMNLQSLIIGAPSSLTQVQSAEPDASQFRYLRTAPASDRIVEYMQFNPGDAPKGRHVINVTVEDLVAGKTTTRSVSIRISDDAALNRNTMAGERSAQYALRQASVWSPAFTGRQIVQLRLNQALTFPANRPMPRR